MMYMLRIIILPLSGGHRLILLHQGKLIGREHLVDVQDDDEPVVPLAHALDELRLELGPDLGRRRDVSRLEVQHLLHRVGQCAQDRRVPVHRHLGDDDAGVHAVLRLRHPELEPQVHHRHHAPPQVDHAAHELRRPRHLGHGGKVQHLADLRYVQGEHLIAELEGQELGCFGIIAVTAMAASCSNFGW